MKRPSILRIIRPGEPEDAARPPGELPLDEEERPLLQRLLPDPEPFRQDIIGSGHALAYFRHLIRGNKIRRRQLFERLDRDHPPVLLLHGFLGTRGSLFLLERRLGQDGICVFSFNLGSFNVRDIRASAFLIHRKIESILRQAPVSKIDIIGHSMGGLIGVGSPGTELEFAL